MAFLFETYPNVNYDIKKNGKIETLTNITVRFKLQDALRSRTVVTYDYDVQDGERPDIIASKYYDDATLDWVIILVNQMVNPQWEWPLDQKSFEKYIKKKYGSINTANSSIHHYEHIVQPHSVLYDGTVIEEVALWVDYETYLTLDTTERRQVTTYEYEDSVNEAKARIKILDEKYVNSLVNEVESIF